MPATRNVPEVLVQFDDCLASAAAERSGVLWRLAEAGRQLDADLARLPAGAAVAEHVEPDLDVLLLVVEGAGWVDSGSNRRPLVPRSVLWLPRAAPRAVIAGPDGLVYLTARQRRPAPTITGLRNAGAPRLDSGAVEGGEAPCLLDRVCTACARISPEPSALYCSRCGEPLPSRAS